MSQPPLKHAWPAAAHMPACVCMATQGRTSRPPEYRQGLVPPIRSSGLCLQPLFAACAQGAGCAQVMAGVSPSLAAFVLLLIGAALGAAAGAGLMWWRHRRQLRYLQPASPRQAYAARYAASPQAGALAQLLPL